MGAYTSVRPYNAVSATVQHSRSLLRPCALHGARGGVGGGGEGGEGEGEERDVKIAHALAGSRSLQRRRRRRREREREREREERERGAAARGDGGSRPVQWPPRPPGRVLCEFIFLRLSRVRVFAIVD